MNKPRFQNSRKIKKLDELDKASIEDKTSDLTIRSKYNFSYFDPSQKAGQNFHDLTEKQLHDLLNSLKEFSKQPLSYWESQNKLTVYDKFPPPSKSDFFHPKHVPHQACWCRFSLGNKPRLVGFTIPASFHGTPHDETKELYDKNTFYVTFIDMNHVFWKTKKKHT